MKNKILLVITIASILCFSGLSSAIFININTETSLLVEEETLVLKISFPDLENINIINEENGHRLEIQDFNYLLIPGKPMLPVKKFLIALPPGAIIDSFDFKEGESTYLDGFFDILPVEHIVILEDSNSNEQNRLNNNWEKNYQDAYSSNQIYPINPIKLSGFGTLRKYSYVSIDICPFSYYPKSKQLYYYNSMEVIIKYKITEVNIIESIKIDDIADEKALNLFFNYEEIKELYTPIENKIKTFQNTYDYVIITTNELKNVVSSSNFYSWKTSLGYNTKIVTITDYEITSQPGVDLAEQIRNFLREYYIPWSIKYVLIVGDYTTVPMRYCSPNPYWLQGTVPTDTYYADLSYTDSESWNSNGDDYYGVYGQDNPDFMPEVYVGRIPTSDISRLIYTLDKITFFEQDTEDWKNNALMGGAMLFYANEDHDEEIDFDIDGARLIDYIEKDLMNDWTTSLYSEYEGLSPSVYPFNPLTEQAFTADWRNNKYAVVNWAAHGSPSGIGRVIWSWDDGDGVPESENGELTWGSFLSTNSYLKGDWPSIVFAVSCNVGYPEPTPNGNLGIDMLTMESLGAAVAVCSATRGAAVSVDWTVSHSGAEALCYEFNRYMINSPNGPLKLGEALYDSKAYVHYNFGWDHEYEFMNMYDYNLYGDPSMIREGINSSAPSAPLINGSTNGKSGVEYDYTFISIDPTDDDLFYYVEWGDGEIENWIGPYSAGEQIVINHSWGKGGSYIIRAIAKDVNDAESDWTTLEVSMPKNKQFLLIEMFLEWLFNSFPIFEYILNLIQ
jgi:hypothetical protein